MGRAEGRREDAHLVEALEGALRGAHAHLLERVAIRAEQVGPSPRVRRLRLHRGEQFGVVLALFWRIGGINLAEPHFFLATFSFQNQKN